MLPHIKYNKTIINYSSINSFIKSDKKKNDANNKTRENIICAIINKQIPDVYFNHSNRWAKLNTNIKDYIQKLLIINHDNIEHITVSGATIRAGRCYNYDFDLEIEIKSGDNDDDSPSQVINHNIELKFNAESIPDTPQFVSPMKPSQYLSKSFEEYHYDNYINAITNVARIGCDDGEEIDVPDKDEFLKQIHSTDPKCMKYFTTLYYKGCKNSSRYTGDKRAIDFYTECLNLSKNSISSFIESTDLCKDELTAYLHNTQRNKKYMLYSLKQDMFYYEEPSNMDDYTIVSYTKNPEKSRYECISKSNKKINVLLRWKNGNGLAFPALQLSSISDKNVPK
jgi:hypothetical protein